MSHQTVTGMSKVHELEVGDKIRHRGRKYIWEVININSRQEVQIQRWTFEDGLVGNETRWLTDIGQDVTLVTT